MDNEELYNKATALNMSFNPLGTRQDVIYMAMNLARADENNLEMDKPIVKLLTFWMMDNEFMQREPSDTMISCGVWQTSAVFTDDKSRYYELTCAWPMHHNLKVGDKRKMYEDVILALCHQVELNHLPKVKPKQ